MSGQIALVILIIVGMVGRSHIIATAASFLLIMKLISLERFFPTIERRGLELGLLFLTLAVLVPFANGKIQMKDVIAVLTSWPGLFALIGGSIAAYMNYNGLLLLKHDPEIIIGIVMGSIIGIVFLKGLPGGPMMAAGLTALLLKLFRWLFPML